MKQLALHLDPSMTHTEFGVYAMSRWPAVSCCGAAWQIRPEGGQAVQRCPDCGAVLVETVARL